MTLRSKLLLALVPLGVVLALLGVLATRTIANLGELSESILRNNYRSVLAVQKMKDSIERIESAATYRAAGRADRAEAQEAPNFSRVEAELRIQEGNITEPGELEATAELRRQWSATLALVTRHRQLPQADQRGVYFAGLEPAFSQLRLAAERVLELNQDAMVRKSDEARRVARRNLTAMALGTLLAMLIGVVASVTLTHRALRPLASLSTAVRRLGAGDTEARAPVSGEDEIAQLGRELNAMAQSLSEYRRSSLGELIQAQQASQAAIDSLPDPVIVLAAGGAVTNVNTAAEDLLRLGTTAAGGDPLASLDPGLREQIGRAAAHVVSGKGPFVPRGFEDAIRLESPSGDRWLLPRASPVYSEPIGIVGASVVLQDVTRLMRFDELKNDLVATVAHEFRTPLTSLRLAIHVCLEGLVGPVTAKQADLLQTAREDCERLQAFVEDLLDLSRIQSGQVEVKPTPLSAKALVEGSVEARRDEAAQAGLQLVGTVLGPVLPVLADPERIELVFGNLISNALKHAPRGSQVELRAEPDGKAVRFSASDEGPGIAREHQQRIFEKFYRLPGEQGAGVGLGLYIARQIVRAHGGEMGVESEPGSGAKFWFTLPVAAL